MFTLAKSRFRTNHQAMRRSQHKFYAHSQTMNSSFVRKPTDIGHDHNLAVLDLAFMFTALGNQQLIESYIARSLTETPKIYRHPFNDDINLTQPESRPRQLRAVLEFSFPHVFKACVFSLFLSSAKNVSSSSVPGLFYLYF